MSLARRHKEKVLSQRAATDAAAAGEETLVGRTEYELMLAQLSADQNALRAVQSLEARAVMKADMLSKYNGYVDGILAADQSVQDDVVMIQLVWRVDAGAYDAAFDIAAHALKHELVLPERFKRDLPTFVAEEFSEAAIKTDGDKDANAPGTGLLLDLLDMLAERDMPDEVRAKLHKAIGFRLEASENAKEKEAAVAHYERALELNEKSGVKKRMEKLAREMGKIIDS